MEVHVLSFDRPASVGGEVSQEAGALAFASPTVTSQLLRIKHFDQGKMLEENKLDYKTVYWVNFSKPRLLFQNYKKIPHLKKVFTNHIASDKSVVWKYSVT